MKKFLSIIYLLLSAVISLHGASRYTLPCRYILIDKSREICKSQMGLREKTGHNDGLHVENYLKAVGLNPKGKYPYCYAGQYWTYLQACIELNICLNEIPIPKSGLANAPYNFAVKHGKKTRYKTKKNDFLIWRGDKGGHIERIDSVGKAGWVYTYGFNTSNGKTGNQREGNINSRRSRNIFHLLNRMRVRGLVGLEPKE